jgi:hypothetical protein
VKALRTVQEAYRYTGWTRVGMAYGSAMEACEIRKNRAVRKAVQAMVQERVTGTALA